MFNAASSNQVIAKQDKTVIHPVNLSLYLTRQCNLSCPSCLFRLQNKDFFSLSSMPIDTAFAIMEYFFSLGCLNVYLQAEGEVLLYKPYWAAVKHCRAMGITPYNLVTNGILIDQYLPEILEYFSGVTISVDGHDPESYIKRRGGTEKNFNRILDNTRRLVAMRHETKKRFTIAYNCVLLESNYHIMPKMIERAQQLGIDRMQFRNFHSYDHDNAALRPLYNTPEIANFIKELQNQTYTVQVTWPKLYDTLETFHCSMLFDTVTIGSDGCFAPCCHIPSEKFYGSFFNDHDGYNKGPLATFRRKFLEAKTREKLPRECWECPRLAAKDVA